MAAVGPVGRSGHELQQKREQEEVLDAVARWAADLRVTTVMSVPYLQPRAFAALRKRVAEVSRKAERARWEKKEAALA